MSARTGLNRCHGSHNGRILNRERLVDSGTTHVQRDDYYSVVVVSGDEDIGLWVVGGAATNLAGPHPVGELSQNITAKVHGRAFDERGGIVGHDPPPEIGAELIVHGIAHLFGHRHGGADVSAVDEMLSFPNMLPVVQRVLVHSVTAAIEVPGDVSDMAGRGAV